MPNFFRYLLARIIDVINIAIGIWIRLCNGTGAATSALYMSSRAFVIGALVILGCLAVPVFIGYGIKAGEMIVVPALIAALLVFIGKASADALISVIVAVAEKLGVLGTPITLPADELKKLLPPFLVIALSIAFIGAVMAIQGPGYYGLSDLLIYAAVTVFMIIFASYIESKAKTFGWIMFFIVMWLFVGHYWWPIQTKGVLDYLSGKSKGAATEMAKSGQLVELVQIPPKTQLYCWKWGEFKKTELSPEKTLSAKVIGRKDDPVSRDGLLEVALPNCDGTYIGADKAYVPIRSVKIPERFKPVSSAPYQRPAPKPSVIYGSKEIRFINVDLLQPGESVSAFTELVAGQVIKVSADNHIRLFINSRYKYSIKKEGDKQWCKIRNEKHKSLPDDNRPFYIRGDEDDAKVNMYVINKL